MKKYLLALGLAAVGLQAVAQNTLYIPPVLTGTNFTLSVHQDSVQFLPGHITHTLGINSQKYLGPTMIWNVGDSISITVSNHIGDTTTMHWHGMHVAPQNDGGTYSMIMDGMDWNPKFTVRNRASTYWYHPHMMAKTAEQAIKGDAGFIIVKDAAEAALALPRTYGVDDFPLVVQSLELDSLNQFMPKGMVDSIVLVNGTYTPSVSLPAQVLRLRLLNGSGERTFNFGLTANKTFSVIGNDNGLLTAPVSVTRIRLSPGERAEVLVDLSSMQGQSLYLMSYASELPAGIQGGPTMPMPPWSPPMNSPLNGIDFNILQINVAAPTANPVTSIPSTLVADTPYLQAAANANRGIMMTADSMMVMDGPFYFNHNLYDMMRIDYRIPLNNVEIWTLFDSTMVAHPFHMHDVHFYILDRNGVAPAPEESGRKDVVLVQPMETVRIIMKFDDFADTTTPYMYHCHILMHEDDGMMGQFKVGTEYTAVKNITHTSGISVYPNPVSENATVLLPSSATGHLTIFNTLGQVIHGNTTTTSTSIINTTNWPPGMYIIKWESPGAAYTQKFIKD